MKRILVMAAVAGVLIVGAWIVRQRAMDEQGIVAPLADAKKSVDPVGAAPVRGAGSTTTQPRLTIAERARAAQRREQERKIAEQTRNLAALAPAEQAQDELLRDSLESPGEWKVLPRAVTINNEGGGHLWFSSQRNEYGEVLERDFLKKIEQLSSGDPRVTLRQSLVRSGTIVLIDHSNRFWVFSKQREHLLQCFDGKRWTERRTFDGRMVDEQAASEPVSNDVGRWLQQGIEDSNGNLHFLSQYKGVSVHTRWADGHWTEQLVARKGQEEELAGKPQFVALPGGRVLIQTYNTHRPIRRIYFDGATWSVITIEGCDDQRHDIYRVEALPDGSVLTICAMKHSFIYWPQGALNSPVQHVAEWIEQLGDSSPDVRDRVSKLLLGLGIQVRPALTAARNAGLAPEADRRAAEILNTLIETTRGNHSSSHVQLGHFTMSDCELAAGAPGQQIGVSASDVVDTTAPQAPPIKHALIRMGADGKWTVCPVPQEQWTAQNYDGWPLSSGLIDARGNFYTRFGTRLPPDLRFTANSASGLSVERPKYLSNDGLVAFETGAIFDSQAAVNGSSIATKSEEAFKTAAFYHHVGDRYAWGIDTTQIPNKLLRFGGPEVTKTIGGLPGGSGIMYVHPLTQGAIVFVGSINGGAPIDFAWLWDGKTWSSSKDLNGLLKSKSAQITALADRSFQSYPAPNNPRTRMASDGKSKLWYWQRLTVDAVNGNMSLKDIYDLQLFDGQVWLDVWDSTKLVPDATKLLATVDNGTALLAYDQTTDDLVWIGAENHEIVMKRLMELPSDQKVVQVTDMAPRTWVTLWPPKILVYEKGQMALAEDQALTPMYVDRRQRIWGIQDDKLFVKIAGQNVQLQKNAPQRATRIIETTDGQLLTLDTAGVSRVVVDETANPPTARAVARFRWPTVRNEFSNTFIDDSNCFWFSDSNGKATRITLPDEFWKN